MCLFHSVWTHFWAPINLDQDWSVKKTVVGTLAAKYSRGIHSCFLNVWQVSLPWIVFLWVCSCCSVWQVSLPWIVFVWVCSCCSVWQVSLPWIVFLWVWSCCSLYACFLFCFFGLLSQYGSGQPRFFSEYNTGHLCQVFFVFESCWHLLLLSVNTDSWRLLWLHQPLSNSAYTE